MAYNSGFPVGYQQYFQPPQYGGSYAPQQASQQLMTPPTIHAEIVQIGGEEEALGFPVGAGQSQMMMARDDSAIYIKTAYANGQSALVKYTREKAKPHEAVNADYVTREEFENRIAEIMKSRKAVEEDE